MLQRHFIIMFVVMMIFSWDAVHAQHRFYHQPVTLEARATQIDFHRDRSLETQKLIVDELGNPIELKATETETFDNEKLDSIMHKWRIRNKYWGKPESMLYLHSLTQRTI